MSPTSTLVPPRRLGTLLRQARVAAGLELADLSDAAGLSVVELDDVEHGRRELDDTVLASLVAAYGIQGATVVPARAELVIDLDEGRIAISQTELGLDEATGPDAILARYLALVYRLREMPVGAPVPLRDVDVEVLSTALRLASDEVERRLHRLMADEAAIENDQRRIRRQLLLPLVGVVVAATTIGTLVLVAREDPGPATTVNATIVDGAPRIAGAAVEDAPAVVTDIGNGGAVEDNTEN